MLGQTLELRVGAGRGEDLGVADGCHPSPLPFERARHDSRTTALPPAAYDLVDELHQLVIQANRDLPGDDITPLIPDVTGYITEGQIATCCEACRRPV